MSTVYRRAEDLPWKPHSEAPGLLMKELLEPAGEAFTVRLHRIPLTGVPKHAHPRRHVIWVLSGRGRLWVEDLGDLEMEPGAFAYVPSDVLHSFYGIEQELELYTVSLPPEAV